MIDWSGSSCWGRWFASASSLARLARSPRANMSDRFDLQLVSGELLDGMGLDYVSGSYHVFGNNGTHTLGAAIDTGTGAASAVLAARMSARLIVHPDGAGYHLSAR